MTTQPPVPESGSTAGSNQALNNLAINYWLSAFFAWIPALIFYYVDKGKNPIVDAHNRANLNFQLVRTIVVFAFVIPEMLGVVPFIGWLLVILLNLALWGASIALFVFAIMAAMKAPEEARAGREYKYPFNIEFVK